MVMTTRAELDDALKAVVMCDCKECEAYLGIQTMELPNACELFQAYRKVALAWRKAHPQG